MIQTEIFDVWEDGTKLIRTYSDENFMIRQVSTGNLYAEAIDPDFIHMEYTETDIPIDEEEPVE